MACCGVTVAQAATLEALADGPLRIVDLGRRLGVSPSTLSRNLDRLEQHGLVGRGQDGADGRARRIVLTAKGRRAAAAVRRDEVDFAWSILQRFPLAGRNGVVDHLEHLLGAVREATEDCCPGAFDHLMKEFRARGGSRLEDQG